MLVKKGCRENYPEHCEVYYLEQKIRALSMLLFWTRIENSGILYIPSPFRNEFFVCLFLSCFLLMTFLFNQ